MTQENNVQTEVDNSKTQDAELAAKFAVEAIKKAAAEAAEVIQKYQDESKDEVKAVSVSRDSNIIPDKVMIRLINLILNYLDYGITVSKKDDVALTELIKDIYNDIKKIGNGHMFGKLDCSNVVNFLELGTTGGKLDSYNLMNHLNKSGSGNNKGNHSDFTSKIAEVVELLKEQTLNKRLFEKELRSLINKYQEDLKVNVNITYPDEEPKKKKDEGDKARETDYMKRVAAGTSNSDDIDDAIDSGEEIETSTEIITPISSATVVIKDKVSNEYTVAYVSEDDIELDCISERLAKELLSSVCTVEKDNQKEDNVQLSNPDVLSAFLLGNYKTEDGKTLRLQKKDLKSPSCDETSDEKYKAVNCQHCVHFDSSDGDNCLYMNCSISKDICDKDSTCKFKKEN